MKLLSTIISCFFEYIFLQINLLIVLFLFAISFKNKIKLIFLRIFFILLLAVVLFYAVMISGLCITREGIYSSDMVAINSFLTLYFSKENKYPISEFESINKSLAILTPTYMGRLPKGPWEPHLDTNSDYAYMYECKDGLNYKLSVNIIQREKFVDKIYNITFDSLESKFSRNLIKRESGIGRYIYVSYFWITLIIIIWIYVQKRKNKKMLR